VKTSFNGLSQDYNKVQSTCALVGSNLILNFVSLSSLII